MSVTTAITVTVITINIMLMVHIVIINITCQGLIIITLVGLERKWFWHIKVPFWHLTEGTEENY
jgi:hypothetical protein